MILFFAVGAVAQTTNDLSDAEIQGRKLAQQLCEAQAGRKFHSTPAFENPDTDGKTANISGLVSNYCDSSELASRVLGKHQ